MTPKEGPSGLPGTGGSGAAPGYRWPAASEGPAGAPAGLGPGCLGPEAGGTRAAEAAKSLGSSELGEPRGTQGQRSPPLGAPLDPSATPVACRTGAKDRCPELLLSQGQTPRGFTRDRQLIENALDVDTASRCFGWGGLRGKVPVAVYYDFLAAFPSLGHLWLFLTLTIFHIPAGAFNFVAQLYALNLAFDASDLSSPIFAFMIGVLQGCPLSALLFTLALDSWLRAVTAVLDSTGDGIVRACADDIAVVVADLCFLTRVEPLFAIIARLANLRLKPAKCHIVPVGCTFTNALRQWVAAWLVANIPSWAAFHVCAAAVYLGFWLGTEARKLQWEGPLSKWRARVGNIAATGCPPSVAVRLYKIHASPVLGYVAQLCPPPELKRNEELQAIHKLLHMPQQALSLSAIVS